VLGGGSEDIGLALTTIAPGNATRRYNPSIVHWRPPVHGRAPWLTTSDYNQAERQQLRSDSEALLAELPVDVRDTLADLHDDLCRPIVATLEPMGWIAGAHWTPEVGFAHGRYAPLDPHNPDGIPLRHDSKASLRGFLLVAADPARAGEIAGAKLPGMAGISVFTGDGIAGAASGLNVARVFWGADAELRFDRRGVDPLNLSQIFVDPKTERPLLHGYQVTTEGLRFTVDRQALDRCVDQIVTELVEGEGRQRWHQAQFLRYLIESRSRAIGISGHDARLGADIIATAAAHTIFAPQLRRLARFWSPAALKTLFHTVREQPLSQHPLMTAARVERTADMLGVDAFHSILSEAVTEVRAPEALRAYFISVILHSLTLRLKLLVTQVGQGDERQLLAHVKLPLQFGADAESSITICEAGAHGDGTVRGVVDNWQSLDGLVSAGYLGTCPNAEEDRLVRRFWSMPERHETWRQADPRDPTALAAIAAELAPEAESLPSVLVRVLFAQEAFEAEPFALYDIAADIEDVRVRAFGSTDQPVLGWELAAAAVDAAGTGSAPVLRRLFDAYGAINPNAEGSLTPAAHLSEQVFRLAAPLCADGCRSCVHQSSDLMSDSLVEASVSRSLLQRFLAGVS
jgi:hypothetical protein